MTQSEWARRVAEIGALDPGNPIFASEWANEYPPDFLKFHDMEWPRNPPAMARAIRQLAADWLAAEGVVAERPPCRWKPGKDWILGCSGQRGECDAWRPDCMAYCPNCGGKIEVTE